jgi:adenylate cyclase
MENEILTSDLKGQRTLTTVVFTDCVGFSARMSVDEEHTLDLIRRDLRLMRQFCEQFEGRVLKTTGDGLLMCFSSAVKAVECAIEIQRSLAEKSAQSLPADSLMHRIGIHLADMYITETDVMGNGVNIAARLQTEADPGGICISQTVFDVAKHGLQVTTKYLGPRELKNIREVVPAYKILLRPEEHTTDSDTETIQKLELSPHHDRIRKLIFYVCKNRWETDEAQLNSLNLRDLFQEFLSLGSDYEHIKSLLIRAVSTLSKQTEYYLVANEILTAVGCFYPPLQSPQRLDKEPTILLDQANLQSWATPLPEDSEYSSVYQQIVWDLEHHPECNRIKKLLYYICKRHWESDLSRLGLVNLLLLVQELHYLAPDFAQLQQLVNKFVQTINKPAEYSLVASTLLRSFARLYPIPHTLAIPDPGLPLPVAPAASELVTGKPAQTLHLYQAIAQELDCHSHSLRLKKLIVFVSKHQWMADASQLTGFSTAALIEDLHYLAPSLEQLQQSLEIVNTLSKAAEYRAIAEELINKLRPLYAPESKPPVPVQPRSPQLASNASSRPTATPAPPPQPTSVAPTLPHYSLFDVRLGILKYTNPLKAKILVFSTLYSDFHFTQHDWLALKQYDLNTLLQSLLSTYTTYTDLELQLYTSAKRLPAPEDLVQAADTVIKCLRVCYLHGSPGAALGLAEDLTQISLDEFEEATQGLTLMDEDCTAIAAPITTPLE